MGGGRHQQHPTDGLLRLTASLKRSSNVSFDLSSLLGLLNIILWILPSLFYVFLDPGHVYISLLDLRLVRIGGICAAAHRFQAETLSPYFIVGTACSV